MVPSPSPSDKATIRAELRSRRRLRVASLSADERAALESKLVAVLLPLLSSARIVGGYSARGSEISVEPVLRYAMNHGISAAYPAFVSAESPMIFRSGTCAEDCPVGGVQPPVQARKVTPDLLLVPLLGADHNGNRIGQGGGHYDRAIPDLRAKGTRIIGVGWNFQLLDTPLVADPWDAPLDGFASPDGVVEFTA